MTDQALLDSTLYRLSRSHRWVEEREGDTHIVMSGISVDNGHYITSDFDKFVLQELLKLGKVQCDVSTRMSTGISISSVHPDLLEVPCKYWNVTR